MGIVIRQSILTSLISYLGVIIGYINLLYLYPRFLELEQVGLLRTIQDFAMLLAPFATFGLGQSIIRFFPQFSGDSRQSGSFISFILFLGLIIYGLFLTVFLLLKDYITGFFAPNAADIISHISLVLWLTFFLLVLTLFEQYSRSLLKVAFPSLLREVIVRIVQAVLVTLYFLKFVTFDTFLILSVLTYLFAIIILAIYLFSQGHMNLNLDYRSIPRKVKKDVMTFSTFSFIGTSAMMLIGKMDSIMVTGMIGLASNAIYTTAYYMATVIEIPKRAITITASTVISHAFSKNDLEKVHQMYVKTSINQLIIGSLLFLGIWANLHNIFQIMPKGDEYSAGIYVVIIVGASKLLDMIFGPSSEVIGLSKYYKFNLIVILLLAGIVVTANYLLIPPFGMEGAAIGSAIAVGCYNLIKFFFIKIKFGIHPFSVGTLKVILIGFATGVLALLLPILQIPLADIVYRSVIIAIIYTTLIIYSKSSVDINTLFHKVWKSAKNKVTS